MKAHLQYELDKFFGDNVSVILYDREWVCFQSCNPKAFLRIGIFHHEKRVV